MSVRLRYQTLEVGELDVHVCSLRDNQQFEDVDGEAEALGIYSAFWPLFGQLWDSGRAMAHLMVDYPISSLRILEVGCGLALSSLVLNQRGADITATDHHPEAGRYLERNVGLNTGVEIPFVRTGWEDAPIELGGFDLIIGCDLLYERGHAATLAGFIDQQARTSAEVLIIDPGRGHLNRFGRAMEGFGFTQTVETVPPEIGSDTAYRGKLMRSRR